MAGRRPQPREDSDQRDFEAAHAELALPLTRYAAALLGSRRSASLPDVLQDAWARAWSAWPPADATRRDAWLFRIVRNRCMDEHRRHRRWPAPDELPLDLAATDDPVSPVLAEEVLRLLGDLPVALRETLWLRAVDGRSYAEIADLQDVPIGTVMSRLHAARTRLARKLR
jgi:RNA polymerase sigma-70 factor (ECF subfamily)